MKHCLIWALLFSILCATVLAEPAVVVVRGGIPEWLQNALSEVEVGLIRFESTASMDRLYEETGARPSRFPSVVGLDSHVVVPLFETLPLSEVLDVLTSPIPGDWDDTLDHEATVSNYVNSLRFAWEQEKQNAKPEGRKYYENMFFSLTEGLLAAFEDPRVGQTPPVKLGFPEIQALIEAFPPEAAMERVEISLNLLTIDAALKRYEMLWWDTATVHVVEE